VAQKSSGSSFRRGGAVPTSRPCLLIYAPSCRVAASALAKLLAQKGVNQPPYCQRGSHKSHRCNSIEVPVSSPDFLQPRCQHQISAMPGRTIAALLRKDLSTHGRKNMSPRKENIRRAMGGAPLLAFFARSGKFHPSHLRILIRPKIRDVPRGGTASRGVGRRSAVRSTGLEKPTLNLI